VRHFFDGRRRKVGIALLLMALLFAGLWGRSLTYYESVCRYGSTTIHEVSSEEGCLIWNCDRRSPKSSHRLSGVLYTWDSLDTGEMTRVLPVRLPDPLLFHQPDWVWRWSGFQIGTGVVAEDVVDYRLAQARTRSDPEDVRQFATTTHFLRAYFDRRTTWMVPYWAIVLLFTLCSAYLILVKPKSRQS
jgi:hypothetical protein